MIRKPPKGGRGRSGGRERERKREKKQSKKIIKFLKVTGAIFKSQRKLENRGDWEREQRRREEKERKKPQLERKIKGKVSKGNKRHRIGTPRRGLEIISLKTQFRPPLNEKKINYCAN